MEILVVYLSASGNNLWIDESTLSLFPSTFFKVCFRLWLKSLTFCYMRQTLCFI